MQKVLNRCHAGMPMKSAGSPRQSMLAGGGGNGVADGLHSSCGSGFTRLAGATASGRGWLLACAMTGMGSCGRSGSMLVSGVSLRFALGLAGTA